MNDYTITDAQVAQFEADGYLMLPDWFDAEEVELLRNIAHGDARLAAEAWERHDAKGATTRLSLRNGLSDDDIYSAIVRSQRIVVPTAQMLGGEVYHYHHKMTMKEPYKGGAWEWHQDYGYWYNNGCLFPYMASCMIAVDRATQENGCLQVIRGSHHMGRVQHGVTGDQTGADMERVEQAMKQMELVYCEMEPGTALFFHCNTLHRSDANNSPHTRHALICCYNAARNDPYKKGGHPNYSPLEIWPDEKVKEVGRKQWAGIEAELLAGSAR